jgi:hypothetical protein
MDILWQNFLGLQNPRLPSDFCTAHFNNQELQTILDSWGGGNVISEPTSIGTMMETFYGMADYDEFSNHKGVIQMARDGLGTMLVKSWTLVCQKRGLTLPEW